MEQTAEYTMSVEITGEGGKKRHQGKELESWIGYYQQEGALTEQVDIKIDFFIDQEGDNYFGYLCVKGAEHGSWNVFWDRILTEIRGDENMIQVCFLEEQEKIEGSFTGDYPSESLSFQQNTGESAWNHLFGSYQKGDVLFTMKKEGGLFLAEGECMSLGMDEYNQENHFRSLHKEEYARKDDISQPEIKFIDWKMEWINENDMEMFRRILKKEEQISEQETPFFQYVKDNGELQLEVYYDSKLTSGTGIYFGETQLSKVMSAFHFEGYEIKTWNDQKFSLSKKGERDISGAEGYQEHIEYNEDGKITRFQAEGILTGWGEPRREPFIEITFLYREDGTLEQKKCFYNPRLFGTTRQSETYYFDSRERLTYVSAYVTYGFLGEYYFYEGDHVEPSYCLELDHMGQSCIANFIKFES